MNAIQQCIVVRGTGVALPARAVTSEDIDARLGKPAGWTLRHSGVRTRYVCDTEDQVDLATQAASAALRSSGLVESDIDAIIFAAAVPYQSIPATAPLVQRRLGIPDGACASFDVNATCLSFLTGLDLVAAMIACGRYRRVLLVASEIASRGLPWESDPAVAALFGDGAAAAVVTAGEAGQGIVAARMETFPSAYEACSLAAGGTRFDFHKDPDGFRRHSLFQMDGRALYRHTLTHFEPFLDRLLGEAGWSRADVDLVIPHQASPGALHHLAGQCGFGPERIIDIVRDQGNQIAASIPAALHEARSRGRLPPGAKALFLGTAAGLSLGGLAMVM